MGLRGTQLAGSISYTLVTYRAKILKKYSTKQNSNWTIEGVTYRRTSVGVEIF
jgi:hypothetical protein